MALPIEAKSQRKFAGPLIAIGVLVTIYSCDKGEPPSKRSPKTLADIEAKITSDAILSMDRKSFSKTYAKLGPAQFDTANALMRWAAISVAASDRCEKVTDIGVSDRATRKEVWWYADCSNDQRFLVSQEQALAAKGRYDPSATPEAHTAAMKVALPKPTTAGDTLTGVHSSNSDKWASFDEVATVSRCDELAKRTMLVPDTFSTGWNKWDIQKIDSSGKVIVERDFSSENAYGMKLNLRYHCEYRLDRDAITSMSVRQPDGWKKVL